MATRNATEIRSRFMGIGTLIKQERLAVPPNQREYAWREDYEVKSLFEDFEGAVSNGPYFLGTIMLTAAEDGGRPRIADGQQRLATTTILLAAIRDYYFSIEEEDLAESMKGDFLLDFDRPTKEWVPKLQLNVDDREFFHKRVLSDPGSKERNVHPKKTSHELIAAAAAKAAAFVAGITAGVKRKLAIARLEELTNFIECQARVIVQIAPDDFSAFVMFETMNDRGLRTSQFDLLKNHLFSLAKDRLDEIQQKWSKMVATVETGDEPALTYLRYLLIVEYGPTKEKEIMETVKKEISTRRLAIEFVDKMHDHAHDFVAIFSPDHSKWNKYGKSTRRHLWTILNDLKVEQIMPLVMAVASRFTEREAQKAMRLFVNWSVRFLISGGRGGLLDKHYSQKAHEVGIRNITTASQLTDALIDILPSDGAFRSQFATATVSRGYLARYYLRALELQVKDDPEPELIPNPSEEIINLEHVLPESPSDDWVIDDEVAVGLYRRLGNLALLQATNNSVVGNASFDEKRAVYRKSAFMLTSMIAREKQWDKKQINERQEYLAKLALKTWPLTI